MSSEEGARSNMGEAEFGRPQDAIEMAIERPGSEKPPRRWKGNHVIDHKLWLYNMSKEDAEGTDLK